jgi:hypothetical protein
MNAFSKELAASRSVLSKAQVVGLMERVCQALEPTPTQITVAEQRYNAVGTWVAEAEHSIFQSALIYAQGSFSLGTVNRPVGKDEFDVDLVIHFPDAPDQIQPAALKKLLGDRLASHDTYAPLLKEMGRCWRINYANEFHLDITPSIRNMACENGGELVPDKKLRCWKTSNPRAYRDLFSYRANLQPRIRLRKAMAMDEKRADIQPFPHFPPFKGVLRRIVQLAKRHRDVCFQHDEDGIRPISVIITTLASRAYEYCVQTEQESEFDLLCEVIRLMPCFIEERIEAGQRRWFIWNETTAGENFAEKWNAEPARAEAFFGWHSLLQRQLAQINSVAGLDVLAKGLQESFGQAPVERALKALTDEVNEARQAGLLSVAPTLGLVTQARVGLATPVRRNTFFGAG